MKVGDMVEVSGIEKRIELIGVKDGRTVLYCERDGEITIHEPCSVKVVPDQKTSQKRVDGRRAVE